MLPDRATATPFTEVVRNFTEVPDSEAREARTRTDREELESA
jgi:hypothetical protein